MKLLLASPRGFCAGVERAVYGLNAMLDRFGSPIYCYQQVVHNRTVVSDFEARGVVFVAALDEVPSGSRLAFSAHGVSPEVRAAAARGGLEVFDLTCPLVLKVHREARAFAAAGCTIALIGQAGHDEVKGVVGEAPRNIVLIESVADVHALPSNGHGGFAYLTQTTLSVDDTRHIVAELKRRFPEMSGPAAEDICYATQGRQEAIALLAREADVALVVGSGNSSNTVNLMEQAAHAGRPAYRIADASEIRLEWLEGASTVALTAGASVPETLVQETVSYLRHRFGAVVEERVVKSESVHFAAPAGL